MVFVSLYVHVHIGMGSHNISTYGKFIKVFCNTSTACECMDGKTGPPVGRAWTQSGAHLEMALCGRPSTKDLGILGLILGSPCF